MKSFFLGREVLVAIVGAKPPCNEGASRAFDLVKQMACVDGEFKWQKLFAKVCNRYMLFHYGYQKYDKVSIGTHTKMS